MRSANRRQILKSVGTASAITLAGCLGGSDEGAMKIGMIEALSGPFAGPGRRRRWATEAAVERVNEEGGINGREIDLIIEDSEADPGTATTKVQNMINQEGVELLCGTFSSSVCLAVGPIATRNQVPYSGGYCATDRLTGADCSSFAFRGTRNNPPIQWAGLGPYMVEQGLESASVLYADYAWGESELGAIQTYYAEEAGGEIVSDVAVPAGTSDFSQYLSNVDDSADALIFIQAGGDSINLLQDIGSFGMHENFDSIATVGAGVGEFLEDGGIDEVVADSLIGINYYPKVLSGPLDTEENQQFHDAYTEIADEPAPTRSSTPGWEAIWLFKDIAEEIDYTGSDQAQDFVDTWRGFEMERSFQYPQGNKYYRNDNQCMTEQYIFDNNGFTEEIVKTIGIEVAESTPINCTADFADN